MRSSTELSDSVPSTGSDGAGTDGAGSDGAGAGSRKAKPTVATQRTRWFHQVPHIAGLVLGFFAILAFLSSLSPVFRHVTTVPREYVDQYYFDAPDTSFAWAFVLALLAAAIAARKRIAWWLLFLYLLLFVLANVSDIVIDHDNGNAVGALIFHLVVLGVLIASYREFYTKVRRGALLKALGTLVAGMAVATLIGWGLVEAFPGTLPADERLEWVLNRVVIFGNIDKDVFSGHVHGFVNTVLGFLGALALIAAAIVLFRSQRASNALTGNDESAIRGLLERYSGADSLGYFATRRDKAVVFAPSGKAAITYRVEIGVCLASGDPIGDAEAWPHAVEAWLALASQYGWAPAVMGASKAGAEVYDRFGLTALELGDEAILHTRGFSLAGREMRPVRQAVTRVQRSGVTARIRRHRDIPADEMEQVVRRADEWRDTETERGFSMALGRLGDPSDGDCLLIEAIQDGGDGNREIVGMLSLVPFGRTGVSLDVMRRSPSAPNGVIEFMVTELAGTSEQHGITQISLNFAMFRSTFEEGARIGAGPVLRFWRSVLLFFSRWWQLETLYRSNLKYRPEWKPRYLCFAENRMLPRISIASGIAEGFIMLPGRRRDIQQHTGLHSAVPERLAESGLLHADGSAPDLTSPEAAAGEIAASQPTIRRPDQVKVRLNKAQRMAAAGMDPYPVAYPPTHTVEQARNAPPGTTVRVAGRLLRIRDHGGVIFALLRDWSGDLQLLIDRSVVGAVAMDRFGSQFDLGDLMQVSGSLGRSRSGELSLLVRDWRMNGKCLHPLPDKYRGLTDPEARVRQRYVDLAISEQTRAVTRSRSAVLRSLRESLTALGYLEVETPILQQVHGGANARPFTTHINAYDLDLYLRIAPELYLKRLCVGGMEKVFELGRTFRNEGVDFSHNPEFTILEAYEAHSDYERMRVTCRELIQKAAVAANGACVVMRPGPDGTLTPVDISGEWPVKTVHRAVSEALGEDIGPETGLRELRRYATAAGVPYQSTWDAGAVVLEMYERLVEEHTQAPTFYKDFPISVSPLTRPHRSVPGVAERWDLVAYGVELGTAYSELTDPIDQRRRLTEQSLLAAGGDPEAMELDEDFLQALEHAMPPTGGLGMGVDRVIMLVTGMSIRETLPFPLAKPR
ncbi:bifunctional lysylphosphatidylglycerol synthetase/lysine--tRNA ligase LysX [Speluncibacter jeojiensis]|uniref:Lysine--tRNA ligase n=1 Tax=Speluncibacter jeojiensis TaxID=2710754 RepID=A0A9X4LXW3_9ACTN|nr:bifunctional lysylphosphatidylglycerol synthetase/lysine--tRNA ligase LysX [Corynebacteriales bacterium D3-21]